MGENKRLFRDVAVGESFFVDGDCKITVQSKSGARSRLLIESEHKIRFSTKAQECRDLPIKDGNSHGTDNCRG